MQRWSDYPIKSDGAISNEVRTLADVFTNRVKANIEQYLKDHPNEKFVSVEYDYNDGAWKLNIKFKKK